MNKKRKVLMIGIFIVMIGVLSGIGFYYWYNNTYFVSTDDARVDGDLIKVSPQIAGKLLEFNVEEGDSVSQDQILGRQDMTNLPDINVDQSIIRAPISGIVIKKTGHVGEIESPGQSVAMIVDPQKLYITADIEETKLGKVKQGQSADITIDQFEGKILTGKVKYVGKASNSAFSVLPTSTSGTFTKVVQRVPVKIEFDKNDVQLLPGTNAIVKIHIK
ncbi:MULTISPECIES: efflux RND transporter periplasmic adaptor subunit [unclassified Clostridium]|uniref:HlyD family secretion protein n=1 Tax=unclassified Clostridium TaxID=2614128 RepID=UPI000297BF58|nr:MULTISPECIES: efflux RND transporter periplasmic adaptor subunit [unclassified Clostridium]EKQ51572.1 MAG: multidrug resistance efflux pump [Clostridium sp. Maddingley MBC34-26]